MMAAGLAGNPFIILFFTHENHNIHTTDELTDDIEELSGRGVALGIDDSWQYDQYERKELATGQIVLLVTDGIWETRNPSGEMFGKPRLHAIIRQNSRNTAAGLLGAVVAAVDEFRQGAVPEDDVTLVVARITQ